MKSNKYILFIISLLFFLSCSSGVDKEPLIEKEINKKIQVLIKNKIDKCRQDALDDAEIHVDSVISEITQNSLNEGIDFPNKPEKKDTDSINFEIKIDSINLEKVIDSLKLKRDTIEYDEKD